MLFRSGLVWATKIATDPFHDIKLYHRAPLHLLAGKRLADAVPHPMPEALCDEEIVEEMPAKASEAGV